MAADPGPVTLPGYAVHDLSVYLERYDTLEDLAARCDVLHEMAGYLRETLTRHAQAGGES